jgi:Peptidase M15
MPGPIYCRVWIFPALIASLVGTSFAPFGVTRAVSEPLNASLSGSTSLTAPNPVSPAGPIARSRQPSPTRTASLAPPPASIAAPSAPLAPPISLPAGRSASTSTGCLPASLQGALAEVQRKFGPVEVVSTHRPGARIAGTGHRSLHANCQAVDFRPARGTYGAVASYLRGSWQGGVGTYSSGHIHIDTGANYQWHSGGAARGSVRTGRRG